MAQFSRLLDPGHTCFACRARVTHTLCPTPHLETVGNWRLAYSTGADFVFSKCKTNTFSEWASTDRQTGRLTWCSALGKARMAPQKSCDILPAVQIPHLVALIAVRSGSLSQPFWNSCKRTLQRIVPEYLEIRIVATHLRSSSSTKLRNELFLTFFIM